MLQVQHLSFAYDRRPIVKDFSAELSKGQCAFVTGPNGCGKTTLLLLLAEILRPRSGTLHWQKSEERKIPYGYLAAETNGHFLDLDARENLELWAELFGVIKDARQLRDHLKKWEIPEYALIQKMKVRKFSTGMKRKLALARLQMSQCPVWIMDEPLLGLDSRGIQVLTRALENHLQNGGCAVIVSHELAPFSDIPYLEWSLPID